MSNAVRHLRQLPFHRSILPPLLLLRFLSTICELLHDSRSSPASILFQLSGADSFPAPISSLPLLSISPTNFLPQCRLRPTSSSSPVVSIPPLCSSSIAATTIPLHDSQAAPLLPLHPFIISIVNFSQLPLSPFLFPLLPPSSSLSLVLFVSPQRRCLPILRCSLPFLVLSAKSSASFSLFPLFTISLARLKFPVRLWILVGIYTVDMALIR